LLQGTGWADPGTTTATVLKVVDGDTIDIRDDVRGRLRVRVLGIDTPETLLGQLVAFTPDPTQDANDRYSRTLAYLDKADGWDIRSKPRAPERRAPTSTRAIRRPGTH
jgi:micrococcal nuclease